MRKDAAREAGLRPVRIPRRIVKGFEGKEDTIDSCYYLSLLDADGDVQEVCTFGVDKIVTVTRSRLPRMCFL